MTVARGAIWKEGLLHITHLTTVEQGNEGGQEKPQSSNRQLAYVPRIAQVDPTFRPCVC